MVFNPSSMDRLAHVTMGCWQAGAFLVLSVSAYYLLKKKHVDFAKASMKIALGLALVAALGQLATGHTGAMIVSKYQPAKMAAFEGHYPANEPAPMYLFGWVDEDKEEVRFGIKAPGMLSMLIHGDPNKPVTGLRSFEKKDRPPVNIVFQSYHLMVGIGMGLIGLSLAGVFLLWRKKLFETPWILRLFMLSVLGPQIANQMGCMSAEVGRQPWIVYGLLRTSEGLSKTVTANMVLTSLIMFANIYTMLFVLFIYLLDRKIKKGPFQEPATGGHRA